MGHRITGFLGSQQQLVEQLESVVGGWASVSSCERQGTRLRNTPSQDALPQGTFPLRFPRSVQLFGPASILPGVTLSGVLLSPGAFRLEGLRLEVFWLEGRNHEDDQGLGAGVAYCVKRVSLRCRDRALLDGVAARFGLGSVFLQ